MSRQVIIEFPDELPEEVLRDPEILQEGKTTIVLEMLRRGTISQKRAAGLLEIGRHALADLIAEHRIPVIELAEQEIEAEDPTATTAGVWKELLDCQIFEEEIYESRIRSPRPEVRL